MMTHFIMALLSNMITKNIFSKAKETFQEQKR